MSWAEWVDAELEAIRSADRWRTTRAFDALGPDGGLAGHGPITSFASNDYLGLTAHPAVIAAAHEALDRWGTGSTASRLVVGTRPVHEELEHELAAWKRTEAALVFTTGYAANLSVLATFAGRGVRVLSDELNHASIIDGCRLSGGQVEVFRHADLDHLAGLLGARAGDATRTVVVTDSVFSMDGDVADLAGLVALTGEAGALLVLDEAHAVLGPDLDGPTPAHVVRVGTLSKALASTGGFVAATGGAVDLLRNRARPFIFTTAPTPPDAAAALAALALVRGPEGDELVGRLRRHVDRVRPGHPSPIVPIVLGSEERALAASARLLEAGVLVPAIRPPTVAPGTSRLRIALSAGHRDEQVSALLGALALVEGVAGAA